MNQTSKTNTLLKLFISTLYISAFTFGGGFVIITFMKKKFVDELHWIDEEEMLDLVAIAQSSPGAIAVNGSIVVGYKIAGIPGVLVSVFGAIIPPMVIISIVSVFYNLFSTNKMIAALLSGMKAGEVQSSHPLFMIWGKKCCEKQKDLMNIIIMIISFCISYFLDINVIFIILSVGIWDLYEL